MNINLLTDDDVKIVEDGSISLIVIHVPRADFNMRPVYVGENPYKGTYKRNHEGDYHATEHEIRGMIRDQNPEGNDNQIIEYYTMDDIDINSLIYDNLNIKNKPNPKATDNLEKLANEYNLNIDDISFITKYINLPAKDRQHFLSLLRLLTSKNIDNSPVLTKPDHKLTIEEKKQTLLASISSNGS